MTSIIHFDREKGKKERAAFWSLTVDLGKDGRAVSSCGPRGREK